MKNHYSFRPGERVKVYNGDQLEGMATIKAQHSADDDYYKVHFDGDDESDTYLRWVMPEWQSQTFDPKASGVDQNRAFSTATRILAGRTGMREEHVSAAVRQRKDK